MKIAFTKQKPLPKESFGALVPGTFQKIAVVIDEDGAHIIGMIHKHNTFAPKTESAYVAVLAREPSHKAQRIPPARSNQTPEERIAFRAGQ